MPPPVPLPARDAPGLPPRQRAVRCGAGGGQRKAAVARTLPPSPRTHSLLPQPHDVVGEVVPLHFHACLVVGELVHLPAQLPHLLLVEVAQAGRALALELLQLGQQDLVLLLQEAHLVDVVGEAVVELLQLHLLVGAVRLELRVDGVGQREVHGVVEPHGRHAAPQPHRRRLGGVHAAGRGGHVPGGAGPQGAAQRVAAAGGDVAGAGAGAAAPAEHAAVRGVLGADAHGDGGGADFVIRERRGAGRLECAAGEEGRWPRTGPLLIGRHRPPPGPPGPPRQAPLRQSPPRPPPRGGGAGGVVWARGLPAAAAAADTKAVVRSRGAAGGGSTGTLPARPRRFLPGAVAEQPPRRGKWLVRGGARGSPSRPGEPREDGGAGAASSARQEWELSVPLPLAVSPPPSPLPPRVNPGCVH